uniref:Tetraspanin n=1 Tax=Arion vulgaris TaxID=1028688 RepID=A0A0B7B361_9EUPU
MVEGGMKCVKYLLFLFNLIFVIAGIGLIAAGAYVKIKLDEYYNFFGNTYMGPGILLIVVGVIIFLLAFFGCCGAVKENYCLTMTFAVTLGIIFILEIAGGIAGFVLRDKIENEIEDLLAKSMNNYNTDSGMRESWDNLQKEFECCGAHNISDWAQHNVNKTPDSCCKEMAPTPCVHYNAEGCASNWRVGYRIKSLLLEVWALVLHLYRLSALCLLVVWPVQSKRSMRSCN